MLLPGTAHAAIMAGTRVAAPTASASALAGMSAAGTRIRNALGMGLFSAGTISSTFNTMLRPPLAQAYAVAQRLKTEVFEQTKVKFTSDADIFSYQPSDKVLNAARGLAMPKRAEKSYPNTLRGKRRTLQNFSRTEMRVPSNNTQEAASTQAALIRLSRNRKSLGERIGARTFDGASK